MAERADRLYEAGLLSRAIDLYEESLTHFADAYCIQSRLAIYLAESGRMEEAAEHYQKAFELMLSSFGRVESHCFGCEGAFSRPLAQGIAERVFMKLAEQQAGNPQVHYLLAYLRNSQQRYGEALPALLRAVELDPAYLNAWSKLSDLAERGLGEKDLGQRATLKIIELDPLARHHHGDLSQVRDLSALWSVLEQAHAQALRLPSQLLPLTAAAQRLEEDNGAVQANALFDDQFDEGELRRRMARVQSMMDRYNRLGRPTPAEAITEHPLWQLVISLLQEVMYQRAMMN
jgi:tetratricopeptide (TPR) repeat protein